MVELIPLTAKLETIVKEERSRRTFSDYFQRQCALLVKNFDTVPSYNGRMHRLCVDENWLSLYYKRRQES